MQGKLYLIPSDLGDSNLDHIQPANHAVIIKTLREFIVEDIRTARRFLKKVDRNTDIDSINFQLLNEHTAEADIPQLLGPVKAGSDTGLLSEAGLPCVADPGSALVLAAHNENIRVVPLTGPSSIFLALMASGFNGQNFCFHGYLPIDKRERKAKLAALERKAGTGRETQIFIETPYRNKAMMESILDICKDHTQLCIAAGLTTAQEFISTKTIREWKKSLPDIHKVPAVFLLQ